MAKKKAKAKTTKKKKLPEADGIAVHCSHTAIVDIESLQPNPRNPNQHPDPQVDLLAKIIQGSGWRNPIVVSLQSGYVVKGHCRLLAAKRLGVKSVPVDVQTYASNALEYADLIADNKIAELAEMNKGMLKDILEEIDTGDLDMDLTAFTAQDLEAFMTVPPSGEVKPTVEFTEELMESQNYVVLYFDNDIDWLQAKTVLELKTVKALDAKEEYLRQGLGRVVNGPEALALIAKNLSS